LESHVQFRYHNLSIREIELIYIYLTKSFYVTEEQLSLDEIEKEYSHMVENDYSLTLIELTFSGKFDDSFFTILTPERWYSIKNIIKEIKHRRGKRSVLFLLKFAGVININSDIVFCIINKFDKPFEIAIEKIEYLVDIVPTQLANLPNDITEVVYHFDDLSAKWIPFRARRNDKNYSSTFVLKDGKWEIIN